MRKVKKIFGGILILTMLASCSDYLSTFLLTNNIEEKTEETKTDENSGGTENPETPATPTETKYAVKIADGIEHGTVAADKTEAAEGETVTLTIAASDGYKIGSVSASDASGSTVALAENYTFAMPKSDVTVTATFEELPPDEFTVTFMSGGAAFSQQTVKDGETASKPNNPTKTGYTFADWHTSSDSGETLAEVFDFETAITENLTLYAKWEANTNTPYQVQHYQQNIENDEYTVVSDDTENLTGTTGGQTNAAAKSYYGFEAQDFEQEEIAADGNTIVKIYYNRNIITLTFNAGGETWGDGTSADKTVRGKYGAAVNAPTLPTKTGYGSSWDKTVQATFTNDETYTATYEAGKVNYTVKHLQQNANDDGYTQVASEQLSGTTGTQTEAKANTYEHFTAQNFSQETISADGTTVVEIRYDRERVTISFDTDGGSEVAEISGRYGATYTKPENSTKQGYTFSEWNPSLPDTLAKHSAKAVWSPNTDTPYTVQHYKQPIYGSTNLTNYALAGTVDKKTGTTGELTEAVAYTNWAAFIPQEVKQETIAADGSTIVKIYYDRKTVTYTLYANGGTWSDGASIKQINGLYKAGITNAARESPTREGYTFVGWTPAIPARFGVIEGEEFSVAKSFTAQWEINSYTVTFNSDGGSPVANQTVDYNGTASEPTAPTKSGYTFAGWYADGAAFNFGTKITGDITLTAHWTANALAPTVTLEEVSTDADLTITESGGTLTATSGFSNYRWKIDGTTAQNGTANSYTPDTSTLEAGYHNITLAVTDENGAIWSATAVITVRK